MGTLKITKKTELARPSDRGGCPSLTGYKRTKGNYLFLTGGTKQNSFLATVEVYNVERDKWSQCPKLNKGRYFHSSCILGDKIYVSGGLRESSKEVAQC